MSSGAVGAFANVPLSVPAWRARSIGFQVGLICAAVALPHLAHVTGAPVLWLLPMHWPVIVAGLVYGPVAGLVAGVLSPMASFTLSGMPPMPSLAMMTVELGLYGLLTGLLRARLRWNAVLAVAIALLAGRIVAIMMGLAIGRPLPLLASTYAKGLICAVAQVATLPTVARWWVGRQSGGRSAAGMD